MNTHKETRISFKQILNLNNKFKQLGIQIR